MFEKLQHAGREVQGIMTRLTTEGASSAVSTCDMQSIDSYLKVSGLLIMSPHYLGLPCRLHPSAFVSITSLAIFEI